MSDMNVVKVLMCEAAARGSHLWDLVPAITGGIIGALAGGIPAWLIAKRQSDETLCRADEQRQDREKAQSFSIHVKLVTVVNSVIHDWRHLALSLAILGVPENSHMEPWQVLKPLIGQTDEGSVRFSAEELSLFMAAREREFMLDLMLLALRHATSIAVMEEYCTRRERLMTLVPHPESFDGEIGKAMVSEEEIRKLLPYTVPLNSMVSQMASASQENLELARKIAQGIGPIVQKYFNDPTLGGLSFPSDVELSKMISDEIAND